MDIDTGRVDAVLNSQGHSSIFAMLELLAQLFLRHDLFDAASNNSELVFNWRKRSSHWGKNSNWRQDVFSNGTGGREFNKSSVRSGAVKSKKLGFLKTELPGDL
jgi:hypothetical protein